MINALANPAARRRRHARRRNQTHLPPPKTCTLRLLLRLLLVQVGRSYSQKKLISCEFPRTCASASTSPAPGPTGLRKIIPPSSRPDLPKHRPSSQTRPMRPFAHSNVVCNVSPPNHLRVTPHAACVTRPTPPGAHHRPTAAAGRHTRTHLHPLHHPHHIRTHTMVRPPRACATAHPRTR